MSDDYDPYEEAMDYHYAESERVRGAIKGGDYDDRPQHFPPREKGPPERGMLSFRLAAEDAGGYQGYGSENDPNRKVDRNSIARRTDERR